MDAEPTGAIEQTPSRDPKVSAEFAATLGELGASSDFLQKLPIAEAGASSELDSRGDDSQSLDPPGQTHDSSPADSAPPRRRRVHPLRALSKVTPRALRAVTKVAPRALRVLVMLVIATLSGLGLVILIPAAINLASDSDMLTIVVLGGFGLVMVVGSFIVTEVLAGLRRKSELDEKTAGRVTRVRGPIRGESESGAPVVYTEVTVEYYTRRGEGPYEVARRFPVGSRISYAKGDRVIVAYDAMTPRRARLAGRVSHWPTLGPYSTTHSDG